MKAAVTFIAVLFFLFYFPFAKPAVAVFSFSIASTSATTISSGSQEIDINLNISSLPSGDSYFRIALQKESGAYFGYIKNNNGDWSSIQSFDGDCTTYYKINDTSITSLVLKFKIGDDTVISNGSYNLKAHRFTSTCKSYSEASNNSSLTIVLLTPTPTNTPTPTPVSTSAPTSSPTSTPIPTPTKTPTPISTTNTPTSKPSVAPTSKLSSTSVLGENIGNQLNIPPPENNLISSQTKKPDTVFQGISMILGIILIAVCAILTSRIIKKGELTQNEEE